MSRTSNSIKNIKYAVIGQGLALIVSFISRTIFVHVLNSEYLGLNGLFTNILSILALTELGLGSAIVYSMYKPLAEKNQAKLKALMNLYKKSYIVIGIIIAIIGSILTPFLYYFIKDIPDIPYIQIIYLMFVMNSVISYFFSYKRSLIIADQKMHIVTFYHYSFYFLLNIAQIIILLLTKNYILYIALQIINTLVENLFVSKKANQLYPFLKEKNNISVDKTEKNIIVRNIKALSLHKIGGVIVTGTDNILISKFVGIAAVGLYSNYLLIINAINVIFGLGFDSITASIGNLGVTEKNDKRKFIFNCVDLIGFWLFGFASICLVNLINPFINIWLSEEYIIPMPIVLLIVLNFYLTGRRKSVLTFKEAFGLFWNDRYKPLFEAGVNIIASIILVKQIGIIGVFIGTSIGTLSTCFWIEPYVLCKYGFKCSVKSYFKKYGIYIVLLFFIGGVTSMICNCFFDVGFSAFIAKLIVCVVVPNILFLIFFWKTEEFQYVLSIIKSKFHIRCN